MPITQQLVRIGRTPLVLRGPAPCRGAYLNVYATVRNMPSSAGLGVVAHVRCAGRDLLRAGR